MDEDFTHARFDDVLATTSLGIGASELNGLMTGYLCGGGRALGRYVLKALELDAGDELADTPLAELMDAAVPWCQGELAGLQLGFTPMLPDDTRPLAERTDAVVEWTRGFLGGFGLAGARSEALSDDGREVLRDLGTVAASQLTLDASDESAAEDDEGALMELIEFVRVGVMLLHTEVAKANATAGDTRH